MAYYAGWITLNAFRIVFKGREKVHVVGRPGGNPIVKSRYQCKMVHSICFLDIHKMWK